MSKDSTNLVLIMNIDENSANNFLLRLALGLLETTECYAEVIRLCDKIIKGGRSIQHECYI